MAAMAALCEVTSCDVGIEFGSFIKLKITRELSL
jgi:hypothetical protein